jgi:ADP-ribose pyrophosphatase YjhB (NUDIX family)
MISDPAKARFKQIAEAHVLFYRNGQVLLLRRFNTGWKDGWFSVVAGHVEAGESVRSAAMREAQEEAGVSIDEDDLDLVHVVHRLSDSERLSFFFRARQWQGEPFNSEPDKCDLMDWFDIDNLPPGIVDYVAHALAQIEEAQPYSDFGW